MMNAVLHQTLSRIKDKKEKSNYLQSYQSINILPVKYAIKISHFKEYNKLDSITFFQHL